MITAVTIEEACDLVTDGTHYTPKNVEFGTPFLTVKDVSDSGLDFSGCSFISEEDFRLASAGNSTPRKDDVLFSKDGTVGKVHVVETDRDFAVLSSLAILRPKCDRVVPRYLGHALRSPSVLSDALKRKTGSAIRRIVLTDLKKVRLPLPNICEQRRIADILDRADALRAKRSTAIAQLDALAQSIFLDMFGDPLSNPKGWPKVMLGEHTSKIGSGATPKGGESVYKGSGIALIRSMNVGDGAFMYRGLAFIDEIQAARLDGVAVEPEDVLLNITGASVARVCRAPADVMPARVNQHVAIVRPTSTFSSGFLEACLIFPSVKQHLLNVAASGATREAITKSEIERLKIVRPPTVLQKRFGDASAQLAAIRRSCTDSCRRLDALFSSLQSRAFQGEL